MAKKVLTITLLSFAVFFFIDELYFKFLRRELQEVIHQSGFSHILAYFLVGLPIYAGVFLLHKKKGFFDSLGLNRSLPTGIIFALVCTLPLLPVYSFFYEFNTALSLNEILIIGLAAGFFEELYFRGFLFGQLYRFTRLGFILSVFLGALLVGVANIIHGGDVVEFLLVFIITFLGGIIFGWVYAEWDFNLWVPIFLHIFLNLSWEMFKISGSAAGDFYANIIRLFTVVLFIVLTLVYKRRKGKRLEITRNKLFVKKKVPAPVVGWE